MSKVTTKLSHLLYAFSATTSRTYTSKSDKAKLVLKWNQENLRLFGPIVKKHTPKKPKDLIITSEQEIINKEKNNAVSSTIKQNGTISKITSKLETTNELHKNVTCTENTAEDPLKIISQSPLFPDAEIDQAQHERLKDYVEKLSLTTLPAVNLILNKTQSLENAVALERWKKKMIQEIGEERFQKYQQDTLIKGINTHDCIRNRLLGQNIDLMPENEGHWKSVQHVLADIGQVVDQEQEVIHHELFYKGKFDCIAAYRDTLCVIEWKTSSKKRPLLSNTYDNPIQLAAYLGAINRSHFLSRKGIDKLSNAMVVVVYPGGEPASVHLMNSATCQHYWERWLERLKKYWTMKAQVT
ncbi:hypothetical protein ACJMK2_036453 [Sinanodonta woodiana]|uniref:Mitochondrial genome maintenance exonuclease 1 n=1 Tax=Sinanodonta woodiana TaxID=1069815 RepID=A0ABD3WH90_SINWO